MNAVEDLLYANTKTGQKMKEVLATTTAYKFMNATEDLPCANTKTGQKMKGVLLLQHTSL
jgi:alkyl hydroperoxide reductase subunit AhpC